MSVLTTLALAALYFGSFFGLGLAVCSACKTDKSYPDFATTSCIGLSTWLLLGGILCAFELATSMVLGAIFLTTLFPTAIALVRARVNIRDAQLPPLPLLMVYCFVLVLAVSSAPTPTFNPVDDFRNYLVVPLRMLATGTVGGTELDSLGVDGFGGQSLLQSLALIPLPIGYITAFDNAVCLMLTVFLISGLGKSYGWAPWVRALSCAAICLVNLQQINVSATYSAMVLLIGALSLPRFFPIHDRAYPLLLGLLLAGLASLKMPFAIFAGIWTLLLAGALYQRGNRSSSFVLLSASLAAVSPWLFVSVKSHWPAISQFYSLFTLNGAGGVFSNGSLGGLFSLQESGYGGNFLYAQTLFLIGCGIAVWQWRANRALVAKPIIGFVAFAATVAPLTLMVDAEHALRYTAPLLAALVCSTLLIVGDNSKRVIKPAFVATLFVAIVAISYPRASIRVTNLLMDSFLFAYPIEQQDLPRLERTLNADTRGFIRAIQEKIPENSTIFAPIGIPFHLDFSRNKIISFHATVLGTPWSRIPFSDSGELLAYLHEIGVDYLFTQKFGVGMVTTEELLRLAEVAPAARMRIMSRRQVRLRTLFASPEIASETIYSDSVFTLRRIRSL